MNKTTEHLHSPNVQRTAEMLREHLELEFVAIHRRRTMSRRVARASGIATMVCFAAIGLWWSASLRRGPANHARPMAQHLDNDRPSANGADAATDATPIYAAIKVTDLSDDELQLLLAATQAQWFVAEIDGKPTAFPLEPNPRKKM